MISFKRIPLRVGNVPCLRAHAVPYEAMGTLGSLAKVMVPNTGNAKPRSLRGFEASQSLRLVNALSVPWLGRKQHPSVSGAKHPRVATTPARSCATTAR